MYFITFNGKPSQCKQSLSKARKAARRKCASSGGEVVVLANDRNTRLRLAVYGFEGKVPRKLD